MCLDFVSDQISNKIRNYIKSQKLPIRVVFTPGRKLRNVFCKSRPYDHKKCLIGNCKICPCITTPNKNCLVKNVVYKITCNLCNHIYIGETSRTCHDRFSEHLRYAKYFNTPSNKEQAFAVHYRISHPQTNPNLNYDILSVQPKTCRRKIFEALFIKKFKPYINLRDELSTIDRFLILD